MIDIEPLYRRLAGGALQPLAEALPALLEGQFNAQRHGDLPRWLAALAALPAVPAVPPEGVDLDAASVSVGDAHSVSAGTRAQIEAGLRQLMPWRKGPFSIHGVHIDTEWRSDWKWDRLKDHIQPLAGRTVLDVGCGSGYHCWRMAGAGAALVIGIDPSPLFVIQHQAMRHFLGDHNTIVLPLGCEQLPPRLGAFDSVFSMGVLYHRRSPLDHLLELRDALRHGGELVLETLVIEGDEGATLVPQGRYAKMRNVWFIPSCATLVQWLRRCGLRDVRVVDVSLTTPAEQRTTDWMRFESLADYLDPADSSRTIEGHPAPRRAILTATRP